MKTRKTTTVTRPRPRKNPHTAALLIALSAMSLAGPTPAEARTESLQDTPISVSAFDRDQIEMRGALNADELLSQTPNLRTYNAESNYNGLTGRNNISLRGANPNNPYNTGNYVDGVYLNPNTRFNPGLHDVQQVEVLRGPQGTLYGRNANGGVVNVITKSGGNRFNETATYGNTTSYRLNDNRFDSRVSFNPNTLGTTNNNTGLRFEPKEPGYNPDLTMGQGWNTGRINTQVNYDPTLTTANAGQDTTVNTTGTPNHDTTSHGTTTQNPNTQTETTTETPANKPCPKTGANPDNTNTGTTPEGNTHQPNTEVAETGDSTGIFNQPQGNGYASYGSPCPKVNRHEINNRIANNARQDSANLATGLLLNSQPHGFFDYNAFNYNTSADELAKRDVIGSQLAQGLTVTHDYVGGPEIPKTYYRVAGGDFTPIPVSNEATTEEPLPEYHTTVDPINPRELSDRMLDLEIKYGPGLTKGYLDEAADLRDDSERYRNLAKDRRASAAKARTDAENARQKAKTAKTKDSREFWEQQAEAYDGHADILEDSARNLDRSAQNNDNAAERYEQDAAQTAANTAQAIAERAQRTAQRAAQAAEAEAARKAEAARIEAERQRQLDELIRRSQQSSQDNTNNNQNGNNRNPQREYRPDGRIPRPGQEPRNETLRKMLD